MEVLKIRKRELSTFYHSNFYKQLVHVPYTLNRIQSYINNPFSTENDYVLYCIVIDNQIISYRSLLHDQLFNDEIVVWSSGSWTNKDYRNQGFSTILYNETVKDYPKNIIVYTRSVESINFYKKKHELYFYYDSNSKELHYSFNFLNKKKYLKPFYLFLKFFNKKFISDNRNQSLFQLSQLDNITNEFLIEYSSKELFPLSTDKIKWIIEYPWLSVLPLEIKQIYDFSYIDSSFKSEAYEIRQNNEVKAFYFRNIRQNVFYLHYAYYNSEKEAKLISEAILAEFDSNNIRCIIIRDQLIIKYISQFHRPFIKKTYKNFLFISSSKKFYLTRKIQHGIGELIFT